MSQSPVPSITASYPSPCDLRRLATAGLVAASAHRLVPRNHGARLHLHVRSLLEFCHTDTCCRGRINLEHFPANTVKNRPLLLSVPFTPAWVLSITIIIT